MKAFRVHKALSLSAAAAVLLFVTSVARADDPKKKQEEEHQRQQQQQHERQGPRQEHRESQQQQQQQHERPQMQNPAPVNRPSPSAQPANANPGGYRPQPGTDRPMQRPAPQAQPQQERPEGQPRMHVSPQERQERPQTQQPSQMVRPNNSPSEGRTFGRTAGSPPPGQTFGRTAPARPAPVYTPRTNVRVERAGSYREVVHAPNGGQIHMDHGHVTEVRTVNGAVIRHEPDGFRRVEWARPGGRVVVVRPSGGYVQKTVIVSNRSYVQRTYVTHGVVFTRVYRPYVYRPGFVLNIYTPVHYWRPGFYIYAYNPWPRPIVYTSWGWGGAAWYGYYGGYFAPAPYYASPAFWLADYMLAATLEQAYLDRQAADQAAMAAAYNPPPGQGLTPDVKQAIADEVARQLREEQAEAQNANAAVNTNPFSGDSPHIFVANASVEAMMGDQSCVVSEGDVLELRGAPPLNATTANVMVRASKGGCPRGATITVGLQDLAEMQNHMRELIDRGLGDMQSKQGQGGLPPMTGDAAAPATTVAWASQIKPEDNVQGELTAVNDEATRAEQEAVNGALSTAPAAGPDPGPAPDSRPSMYQPAGPAPSIGLNSTIDQVVRAWGQPERTVDLGAKKIYIYKDVKVTFQDGKVVDVQ